MEQIIIGICDDQPIILKELKQIVIDICKELNVTCEVRAFMSGADLLEQIQEVSIVFLDIEMPNMDGIELGRLIKEKNPECRMIMATGTVERFKEAFQIQAIRFVTKPFEREEVVEALTVALDNISSRLCLELFYQRSRYEIPQEDVEYIEAYNGYAEFIVKGKRFRREASLDEIEKVLDKKLFIRISRKNIVNLRWIDSWNNNQIWIENVVLTISKRKKKEFEQRYIEYDLKCGRRNS